MQKNLTSNFLFKINNKEMEEHIKEKAKKVKLLILDVDGVLTDGSIIYDSRGRDLKRFNVKDGLAVFLLHQAGVQSVILTAKYSKVLKRRAKDMRIKDVFWGYPKADAFGKILSKYKVSAREVCYIGDDLIDIEVAKKAGFSVAVNDACPELKDVADFVTKNSGGKGAVRELVEILMKSKGLWAW